MGRDTFTVGKKLFSTKLHAKRVTYVRIYNYLCAPAGNAIIINGCVMCGGGQSCLSDVDKSEYASFLHFP